VTGTTTGSSGSNKALPKGEKGTLGWKSLCVEHEKRGWESHTLGVTPSANWGDWGYHRRSVKVESPHEVILRGLGGKEKKKCARKSSPKDASPAGGREKNIEKKTQNK